jgi:hypothetical protein
MSFNLTITKYLSDSGNSRLKKVAKHEWKVKATYFWPIFKNDKN